MGYGSIRSITAMAIFVSVAALSSVLIYHAWKKSHDTKKNVKQQKRRKRVVSNSKLQSSENTVPKGSGNQKQDILKKKESAEEVDYGKNDVTKGTALYKEGKYEEAIASYSIAIKKSLAAGGRKDDLKVMYSNRAAAYEKLNDFQAVVNDCTLALELDRQHVKALKRRARAHLNLSKLRKAMVDYSLSMYISRQLGEADDPETLSELMRLEEELVNEATVEILKDKEFTKTLPPYHCITNYLDSFYSGDVGTVDLDDGSVSELTKKLEQLNTQQQTPLTTSKKAYLLYSRAQQYRSLRLYREEFDDLEAVKLLIKDSDSFYSRAMEDLGTFRHLYRDYEGALEAYNLSLQANPSRIITIIKLAGLSVDMGKPEEASKWYEKGLKVNGKCASLHFHKGQMYFLTGKLDEAVKCLEETVKLAPDFAMGYLQLAIAMFNQNDTTAALKYCHKARKLEPSNPYILAHLGDVNMSLGRTTEGLEFYDLAIQKDPTFETAYIKKALALFTGNQETSQPKKLLKQALTVNPTSQDACMQMAYLLMAERDNETAMDYLKKAIDCATSKDEMNEPIKVKLQLELAKESNLE